MYMRGEALHALTNDSITRYWGQLMQQLFSGATVLTKPHEQLQQCTPSMYDDDQLTLPSLTSLHSLSSPTLHV